MERVLVVGCSGSGKSTFARRLAAITGLRLYYLDMLWHKADRTTVSRAEFDTALDKILAEKSWIIDGNYQRTIKKRLERCDTVFLFDIPQEECLEGVRERIGKRRPDMPWVEREFDPEFREWIINFRRDRMPELESHIAHSQAKCVIFKSRTEAEAYLQQLQDLSPRS